MKASAILRNARSVLANNGWCQGALARNKYRHEVDPTSKSAAKFCAFGAVHAAAGVKADASWDNEFDQACGFLRDALPDEYAYWRSVDSFNDKKTTKKDDVLDLFDRAIKLAKKDEKISIKR